MNPRLLALALLWLSPLASQAAGPKEVAVADRSLWPTALRTPRDFDTASRAENLMFAQVLGDLEAHTEDLPALLGVKQVHGESVRRWLTAVKETVVQNLRAARASCATPEELGCAGEVPTPTTLGAQGRAFVAGLAPEYKAWRDMDARFYSLYAREQLRLAALFPSPTSEILTLAPGEITGSDWPDRQFLLTFDDGPTPAGGGTDRLVALLAKHHASGFFFVLGDSLETRLGKTGPVALQTLYQGQCVGSHGQEHKSHQKLATWKDSVTASRGRVESLGLAGTPKVLFRPPYGQRTEELTRFLTDEGASVVLWNIDSQDWNASVAPGPTTDRVINLMLLWRRGILLFHDVHDKVHVAVPRVLDFARSAGLEWKDCKAL